MRFQVSDIAPPPLPIQFQTWIICVLLVEVLAIIVGTLVLIAFRKEKGTSILFCFGNCKFPCWDDRLVAAWSDLTN